MTRTKDATIAARLEYLRGEIEAERISMSEIAELQSLAEYIDPSDVLLLEWAGVPEHRMTRGEERIAALTDIANAYKSGAAESQDDLEALAARFERNAADWRAIGGNPDLAAARGMGFSSGMAEAWRLAAEEVRAVLRRDPAFYDLDAEERGESAP